MKFKIKFPTGYNSRDIHNDNIDINIVLEDGRIYFGSVFTLDNIKFLMDKENDPAQKNYFWATDMVIVRVMSVENIEEAVQSIIELYDIDDVFSLIGHTTQNVKNLN